jgi:hypothetical protein
VTTPEATTGRVRSRRRREAANQRLRAVRVRIACLRLPDRLLHDLTGGEHFADPLFEVPLMDLFRGVVARLACGGQRGLEHGRLAILFTRPPLKSVLSPRIVHSEGNTCDSAV